MHVEYIDDSKALEYIICPSGKLFLSYIKGAVVVDKYILLKDSQYENDATISTHEGGSMTVVNKLHEPKALSPIDVTLLGIVISDILQ